MTHRGIVNQYLTTLSDRIGAKVELNEEGVCALDNQNTGLQVVIEVPSAEPIVIVYSVLGLCPHQNREHYFAQMLNYHRFGLQTGGASFAYDDQKNEIVLWISCPVEHMSGDNLVNLVERFADLGAKVKEKLSEFEREGNNAPAASSRDEAKPIDPPEMGFGMSPFDRV